MDSNEQRMQTTAEGRTAHSQQQQQQPCDDMHNAYNDMHVHIVLNLVIWYCSHKTKIFCTHCGGLKKNEEKCCSRFFIRHTKKYFVDRHSVTDSTRLTRFDQRTV